MDISINVTARGGPGGLRRHGLQEIHIQSDSIQEDDVCNVSRRKTNVRCCSPLLRVKVDQIVINNLSLRAHPTRQDSSINPQVSRPSASLATSAFSSIQETVEPISAIGSSEEDLVPSGLGGRRSADGAASGTHQLECACTPASRTASGRLTCSSPRPSTPFSATPPHMPRPPAARRPLGSELINGTHS